MRRTAEVQRPMAQLVDLTLVQMSNWRWSWPGLVLAGTVTPLVSVVALSAFADGRSSAVAAHILVGNVVLALLFQNQNQVAANFSFMKANGMLDFFAAQPVRRSLLAVATVTAFFVISVPALILMVLLGGQIADVELSLSPLIVVVVPLCVVPAAAIGALIGSTAGSIEVSSSASLMTTIAMTGLGPVLIPPDRLPGAIQAVGRLNPATYAASALRDVLVGPVDVGIIADLAVLAGFGAVALLALVRTMPWRAQ